MIARLKSLLDRLRTAPVLATAPVPAAPPLPPAPTLAEELALSEQTTAQWTSARRTSHGRLYSSLSDPQVQHLVAACPDQVRATTRAADRVCRHEFDILGSGPFVPVDPGRPKVGDYQPIDWYLDPILNLRFPEKVPYKSWNLMEMRPGLADVKLPWEIGRCQHWLPLAQAFAITRDERYAAEILNQHDDFVEANPVGFGIQWTCTMDVAIRALNWAQALELVQSRTAMPALRLEMMYASLFTVGHFIERNLENHYEVTSNHFLSNVIGLFGLGVLFADLPSGQRWLGQCRGWLEQEMRVQVLPDGADYESSVPYHRLVTELFLSGWRSAECEGTSLSASYREKLAAMVDFLRQVLRPDGKVPQIGDADDGRVHIFSDYGRWDPQDARHIFAPAAAILGRPEWALAGDPWASWETAWWGCNMPDIAGVEVSPVAQFFPDAGLAVVKNDRHYLLIANAKVGTNGFGNHKHNDLLSFEFHDRGTPVFVDPGSYVYTSNPEMRNHFRSTAAHNTVVVDGVEQNEFKTEWLFRMFEKAIPEHVEFVSNAESTRYRGRHHGYARLPQPVIHERALTLQHDSGVLSITDSFYGHGQHTMAWHFHCAPGISVTPSGAGQCQLAAGDSRWSLRFADALASSIAASWYSPSYGVRQPATVIAFAVTQSIAPAARWTFTLEPQS